MTYIEKLKDPRWQKVRLKVLERDQWKCVLCNDEKHNLQIHHIAYKNNPWDIPIKFLKTLCENCHKGITIIEQGFIKLPHFPDKAIKILVFNSDDYLVEKIMFRVEN